MNHGKAIRNIRRLKGLTLEQFGAALGVSKQRAAGIERSATLSQDVVFRAADALGVRRKAIYNLAADADDIISEKAYQRGAYLADIASDAIEVLTGIRPHIFGRLRLSKGQRTK